MDENGVRPHPESWRWARLGDFIVQAQPGFAIGERDPKGVIQLRMNNVARSGQLDWTSFIRVPASQNVVEQFQLLPDDVMFNNTNSVELVGKSALFPGYAEPVVYSNHFTRLRTQADVLDPRFLAFWLQEQWRSGVFAQICNRWIGQAAVKSDKLLALKIPLPPLPEQRRIAAIITEQIAEVDKARVAVEEQLAAVEKLPTAILRRAFNGEL